MGGELAMHAQSPVSSAVDESNLTIVNFVDALLVQSIAGDFAPMASFHDEGESPAPGPWSIKKPARRRAQDFRNVVVVFKLVANQGFEPRTKGL